MVLTAIIFWHLLIPNKYKSGSKRSGKINKEAKSRPPLYTYTTCFGQRLLFGSGTHEWVVSRVPQTEQTAP